MHRAKRVYIDIKLPFRMSDRLIHDGSSLLEQMLWKKTCLQLETSSNSL